MPKIKSNASTVSMHSNDIFVKIISSLYKEIKVNRHNITLIYHGKKFQLSDSVLDDMIQLFVNECGVQGFRVEKLATSSYKVIFEKR